MESVDPDILQARDLQQRVIRFTQTHFKQQNNYFYFLQK